MKKAKSKLIGKRVFFKGDKDGNFGVIIDYTGKHYIVAFCGDVNDCFVCTRNEIVVNKSLNKMDI